MHCEMEVFTEKGELIFHNNKIFDINLIFKQYKFSALIKFVHILKNENCEIVDKIKSNVLKIDLLVKNKNRENNDEYLLNGIIVEKKILKYGKIANISDFDGAGKFYLIYEFNIIDCLQAIWRKKYITKIYTDQSYEKIILDNLPESCNIDCLSETLKKDNKLIVLNSDYSFYNYFIYIIKNSYLCFYFDYKNNKYIISDNLELINDSEISIIDKDVSIVLNNESCNFIYYNNGLNDVSTCKNIDSLSLFDRHIISNFEIMKDFDEFFNQEKIQYEKKSNPYEIIRINFPDKFSDDFLLPNRSVIIKEKDFFNLLDKYFIVLCSMYGSIDFHNFLNTDYDVNLNYKADLSIGSFQFFVIDEEENDYVLDFPPVILYGEVLSEIEDETFATYDIKSCDENNIKYYSVKINILKDTIVQASLKPNLTSGQMFFPLKRLDKIICCLYYDRVEVLGLAKWSDDFLSRIKEQYNCISMGKNDKSSSVISHYYEGKKSNFSISSVEDNETKFISMNKDGISIEFKCED